MTAMNSTVQWLRNRKRKANVTFSLCFMSCAGGKIKSHFVVIQVLLVSTYQKIQIGWP